MDVNAAQSPDNLWRLAQAALHAVNRLQSELSTTNAKLLRRQSRIRLLEGLATTDELTSLTNRRGFMDAFDRELDKTSGQTQGGLLIMVDMDNKVINDTYGHMAGDEALRLTQYRRIFAGWIWRRVWVAMNLF